jgi:hypothetical protein
MGYENPGNVTDYAQVTAKNEWTVFVRVKEAKFKQFIS